MSESKNAVFDVAASASTKATAWTYGGAGGGFIAHLLSIDILAWLGISIALGGFVVNWHYKRREDKRAQELHELKVKNQIKRGENNVK